MLRSPVLLAMTLVVGVATACSGSTRTVVKTVTETPSVSSVAQSPSSAPPKSSAKAPAAGDAVAAYMKAFNSADPDQMSAAAKKDSVPKSLAYAYLVHQTYLAEADLDGGDPQTAGTARLVQNDSAWQGCDDPSDATTCLTYSKFQVDSSGLLSNFVIDGKPIKGRIALGDGQSETNDGVTATFLSAYKSAAGTLFVIVQIKSSSNSLIFNLNNASYRAPNGDTRNASDSGGASKLSAHSQTLAYAAVPGVTFGGNISFDGCAPSDCTSQFRFTLKV